MTPKFTPRYAIILFDLDGVLTDSHEGILNSIEYTLRKMNIQSDRARDSSIIGPPIRETFIQNLGIPENKTEEALKYYREYFKEKGILENRLYPGIKDLLYSCSLRGWPQRKLFVATSKPTRYARQILKHFGIDSYFQDICGSSMDDSITTKTDIIQSALSDQSETPRERIVMVGDKMHDIVGAKENDIDSIGVLYGYGTHLEIGEAKPTYIARTTDDLERLLNQPL